MLDDDTVSTEPSGEIKVLIQSLEDHSLSVDVCLNDDSSVPEQKVVVLEDAGFSLYGKPLSVEEASLQFPVGTASQGMVFHATLIPDELFQDPKALAKNLKPGDYDAVHRVLKPRRPSLPVRSSRFFSSLTRVGPRFIFSGVLNGWPALRCFEVVAIARHSTFPGRWTKIWKSKEEGSRGIGPKLPHSNCVYRVTLVAPSWTAKGWSPQSPGYAFWFEAQLQSGPRLSYGKNMTETVEHAVCQNIHMISHRYAVKHESPKDLVTYHSICVLEWEHGRYVTIVEVAFLNGIGGYKGRSNWYEDRDDPGGSLLYLNMKPEMIQPWRTNSAEIRCYDVEATSIHEVMGYIERHRGKDKRFVDPKLSFSHQARLTFRTKAHIAQYLLNYISRDSTYGELRRNCQTFAADLCSFIAGKKEVVPYHPVNRIEYSNRTHLFLYESHMYRAKHAKK